MNLLNLVSLSLTLVSIYQCCHAQDQYEIESSAFCGCPPECLCTSTKIDCSEKSLTTLPSEFELCDWPDVETLIVTGNQITTINAESFNTFSGLRKLYLNTNNITKIHSDGFLGLNSLSTLDLSKNKLTSLEDSIFHSLQNLTYLFLYANEISNITENAFQGLIFLRLLSLDDNRINYLHADTFQYTKNLQRLLLYQNHISSLPAGIFKGLNSLVILAVFNNKLSKLNNAIFSETPNLQRLYIHNNEISNISDMPFQSLQKLLLLYFSGNHLTELSNTSLTGMSSLHTLVLSHNQIFKIHPAAFSHTPILQELYMDDNRVERISPHTFARLTNLRILRLGSNNLRVIEDGSFARQWFLYKLYLFDNQIQHISNKTFAGLYGIVEIALHSNRIASLPGNAFQSSRFLENLWLRQNEIRCVDERGFTNLNKLQLLDLSGNQISYLPNNIFQPTPNLRYLILANNKLTQIETRPFRNLPFLIQLVLYYNKITYIAEGALEGTENILFLQWNVVLNFDIDNSLHCNCNALWLQHYLQFSRPYYSSVFCGGPNYARGKNLRFVSEIQQNCTQNLTTSVTPDQELIYLKEGGCLRLKCEANKYANITWSRQEGKLRTSPHEECGLDLDGCGNVDTMGLLTTAQFTKQDEGTYRCTAVRGEEIVHSLIRVVIGESPTVLQAPANQEHRDPPPHVVFSLRVAGIPEPSIQWFHNGREVSSSDRYHMNKTGSLIILGVEYSDNGEYKAVAENDAGMVEVSARLDIHFPSPCFGTGCANGGICLMYHQCECASGFIGDTCEETIDEESPSDQIDETYPSYSGDHYYDYSGDYYDYKRKKRGVKSSHQRYQKEHVTNLEDPESKHEQSMRKTSLEESKITAQEKREESFEPDSTHLEIKHIDPKVIPELSSIPVVNEQELKMPFQK